MGAAGKLWILVTLSLLGSSLAAQGTRAQPGPAILASYRAPAECPRETELARRIAARTAEGRKPDAHLTVHIELTMGRARGAIAFESGAEQRTIEASSCAELVEALALVGALMLAPVDEPKPAASALASVPARARGPSAARAPESAQASTPVAAGADSRPSPGQGATDGGPATETVEATPPPPPQPASAARRHGLALLAAALWTGGIAPSSHFAFGAAGEYQLRGARLSLLARAGLRGMASTTLHRAAGDATFGWWSSLAALCGERATGRFSWAGCGLLELGQLRAAGSSTRDAQSARRTWLALGPSLQARSVLAGPLFLQLALELLLPLAHHRYVLAENTVHSVPWLSFRGELALGVQFW